VEKGKFIVGVGEMENACRTFDCVATKGSPWVTFDVVANVDTPGAALGRGRHAGYFIILQIVPTHFRERRWEPILWLGLQ
jgi:hypothetical protein